MNIKISLGLVLLSGLLVVALRRGGDSPHSMREGRSASAGSRPVPAARLHAGSAFGHGGKTPPQPDRASLLAAIEAESDPDRMDEALERAVESVSDADLPAVLDALALETGPVASAMGQSLVRRWAENDPIAASRWAALLPANPHSRAAWEQVAIAWAGTDLPAATSWVLTLPAGDSKEAATIALAYEAIRTGPLAALGLACALPPTLERDELLVHAASQWAGADFSAAEEWAGRVPDADLRQRLLAAVAVAAAEQDGPVAATLIAHSLIAGGEQDRAAVSIVQRWAQHSPSAAAAWIAQFPEIPARAMALQQLLAVWTNQDGRAAGDWLAELPAGSLRETGLVFYALELAGRDRRLAESVVPAGL